MGDLGAGKTTLVRGLAHGFGSKQIATSPSFSLSNVYATDNGKIYHFDLYRLGNNPGALADEFAEALAEQNSIVVVEWGKSIEKLLLENTLSIELSAVPKIDSKRAVTIKYQLEHEEIILRLETIWEKSKL